MSAIMAALKTSEARRMESLGRPAQSHEDCGEHGVFDSADCDHDWFRDAVYEGCRSGKDTSWWVCQQCGEERDECPLDLFDD